MENLSQKSYSGNGFAGKTVYDDSAKFGVPILSPRAEDYTEIFEGFRFSRGSSIPMLDLPAVDDEDADLFFDVRSSNFDYSEVFGGFNGLEFAVSYQELFKQSNGVDDSTPEAWTPAQSEYLTDESDSSVCSEKNQCSSIRDLRCSFDGTNQFSVLYHKANPNGKEDILIGTSHVTQLDTVPGYSFNGNEIPPAQKIEDENLHLNLDLGADFDVGVAEGKGFVITTPQHLTSDFDEQEYESELSPSAGYDKASSPQKTFISVPDISLRTKPSHWPFSSGPPPVFSDRIGNSTKLNTSINNAFERAESDCSPPCFDVEIDASSSTAASAAAMKDVAEKARAQLRSVKESTERKKECLQSCTKLQSENYIKNKEEKTSEFERFNSFKNERVQGTCEREGKATENYAAECRKKVSNTNVAQKVREWQEKEKKTRVTPGFAESKKVLYDRDKFQNGENVAEDQLKENEVVFEQKLKGSNDRMECETRIKEAHERKESGREIKESFDSGQCERGFKEDVGRVRNWRKLKKELELGTKENQGIYASMEGQKASDGVCIPGETETPQATHNKIQGKLQTQNACLLEENERLGTKPKCSKREMEAVEGENRPIEESFNSSGMDAKEMLALEDREKEERLKKERDLENDRVGKIKEERGREREREREREKDRMAVNKATCEARERASAEARDRAERAAVDSTSGGVRQKALAEACERLEKASAETRERLNAEKVRGRDFEKATAKKVSAEARERVERSRFEGESAQRCKARLERHRRTAERAAKALAEKNMRDVLVHKELAERKRLAEALDTDIKRWSSGKEENLRALLSTLQYILGLDSGWQPIPLTEVITAVAVKKAYRKAMLCVHPDKLQQRGASLQQKYICEKVFDLLKEAWNKFNSEER